MRARVHGDMGNIPRPLWLERNRNKGNRTETGHREKTFLPKMEPLKKPMAILLNPLKAGKNGKKWGQKEGPTRIGKNEAPVIREIQAVTGW